MFAAPRAAIFVVLQSLIMHDRSMLNRVIGPWKHSTAKPEGRFPRLETWERECLQHHMWASVGVRYVAEGEPPEIHWRVYTPGGPSGTADSAEEARQLADAAATELGFWLAEKAYGR